MYVNKDECRVAGLDEKEVARIARGLSRYAKQAEDLGIQVFGGMSGTLRFRDSIDPDHALIVASLDGDFDGGDGGYSTSSIDGLLRGE